MAPPRATLMTTFHGGMKYTTFFGTYLHALVSHAPHQFEIVSLRSVNTENQERLFEQARRSATAASNRQPQNVLCLAILRLQAKAAFKPSPDSQKIANSPKYLGTYVSRHFVKKREKSWEMHLRRISHYLVCWRDVWWKDTDEGYQFLDGHHDPTTHPEGPTLRHFRSVSLKEVTISFTEVWNQVLTQGITLPTTSPIHSSSISRSQKWCR